MEGTTLHCERIQHYIDRNLMQVTALGPAIGHEEAAEMGQKALTLREAALQSGLIDEVRFDEQTDPKNMV